MPRPHPGFLNAQRFNDDKTMEELQRIARIHRRMAHAAHAEGKMKEGEYLSEYVGGLTQLIKDKGKSNEMD